MKKMSKGMLMTALICGAVYLGGSPVYASELQEFSLDEYVVTAARTETKLVDTPANISVVDAQTIEERHYQDVSEVLKDVPGAHVMDTGSGAFEKTIKLNGDDRVLIMIDGRKVDFASGTSTGNASFDMGLLPDVNLIERIEVIKGASGALYGSDAVGGVINIITKKADSSYGKINIGFGSNDKRDMSALYSLREGKTGVTVSAAKEKQGYFKYVDANDNKNKRWPGSSNLDSEKIALKVTQDFTNDLNLELGYNYNKYEGFSAGKVHGSYGLQEVKKEVNNVYAKLNWTVKGVDAGYLQVYHNEFNYDAFNHGTQKIDGAIEEKTNGFDLQQVISVSNENKLVFGTSWRKSDVNNPGHYSDNIDNLAFFMNDTWEFAPTWTLNTGVRYDDHSESGNETTLSAGLNKKFDENSHIYFNWGEVFKTPTTADLFEYNKDVYPGGYWETIGDRNLKPETGDTWTIGYQTKFGEKTDVGISYFRSDLENAIDWVSTPFDEYWSTGKSEVRNVDKQKKRGMELTINHSLNDNVDLTATYTYIKVEDSDGGSTFIRNSDYIPNTYRFGVRYVDGKWNSNIWLRSGSGAETSNNKYVDSKYVTVDLTVSYNATRDLMFYAKGYNLFNEAYADCSGVSNGSYIYPAQSRRFIVGAEYKF